MRLKAFRVQMYRPILDSGWIDVDDITVVVGKNESGKTALLKALHKFKPFNPEPYTLDREWPRGHRQQRSPDAVVVEARFDFEPEESNEIATAMRPSSSDLQTPTGVRISKTYGGDYAYDFVPNDIHKTQRVTDDELLSILNELEAADSASDDLKAVASSIRNQATSLVNSHGVNGLLGNLEDYRTQFKQFHDSDDREDEDSAARALDLLGKLSELANAEEVRLQIENMVYGWIPTFIYMDEHKPFQGSAYLDQIGQRKSSDQLTDEDKTFLMILKLAGLDFDEEMQKAQSTDKEQRMLDMNDASSALTSLLADHWSQRKYQVRLEADGHHVIVFVCDEMQTALVPLNERSKGFQWFFSFDTTFLHETQATFENAVILLDEPGLHLHASAQRDLLSRIKEYSIGNQLIYTTHMPFMIDTRRLDNIRVCVDSKATGTVVSSDLYSADKHSRFPLQAAMGLSISQSLFVGPYNLVVEGVTDFWLLSAMATVLRSEGRPSLDERIVITPAGGATRAAYVATMLQGQDLDVVVLFDSDAEGKIAADGLIKKWVTKDKHVLFIGKALQERKDATLEDLFPDEFYLKFVNSAYRQQLGERPITPDEVAGHGHPQLIRRVDTTFGKRQAQRNSEGWFFNKGRVAKLMVEELATRNLSDLPAKAINNFENLFQMINKAMPGLSNHR
ncbi:MAG: AAA family ATPase [Gammaproteobacteria bacterium]|nr:AAA family ATPase [Gammaproteobacteria bacterium]